MKKFVVILTGIILMPLYPIYCQHQDIALQAYELRMNGDANRAMQLLDSALRIYPDSARFWFEKGRIIQWNLTNDCNKFIHLYTKMSPRIRKSKRCFRKAIRLDPWNARYYYWAGGNYAVLALTAFYTPWEWPLITYRSGKAAKLEKKAVLLDPENPEYRFALVEYSRFGWLMGGDRKLALAHLDTLDKLYPVHGAVAHVDMADKKHPFDLLARLQEIRLTDPDNPRLIKELIGPTSRLIKDDSSYVDTVMNLFVKYMELDPANPEIISRMYRFINKYKIGDPIPWVNIYMEAVEGSYGYYRGVGLRLLADDAKKKGDETRAEDLKKEAGKLISGEFGSIAKDWGKP